MCIIWTVRQCIHLLSSIRLSLRPSVCPSDCLFVRLSVGAAEINDKVDLRAVGNCVQVNWNAGRCGRYGLWAWHCPYRNDLLAKTTNAAKRIMSNGISGWNAIKMQFEMQNILPAATCGKRWVRQTERDSDREKEKGRGQQGMLPKNGATLKMPLAFVCPIGCLPKCWPKQKAVFFLNVNG